MRPSYNADLRLTLGSSYALPSSLSNLCLSNITSVAFGPTYSQFTNCGIKLAMISRPWIPSSLLCQCGATVGEEMSEGWK